MLGEAVLFVLLGLVRSGSLVDGEHRQPGRPVAAPDHPRSPGDPFPGSPGGQATTVSHRRTGHDRQDVGAAEAPIGQGKQRAYGPPVEHVPDAPDRHTVVRHAGGVQLLV